MLGPVSLDHMYTYQDLCPWIICILTRTYVLLVTDGSGRPPAAQSAKRCFLNAYKLAANLAFTCRPALPASKLLAASAGGFRLAQLRSKDAAAALKHHGSEGRIGPAAGSPECQTLLSERLETSCKPGLYLPFGTASFQIACCILQVAFVWHTSGPRVPRAAAQGAKRCMPRN